MKLSTLKASVAGIVSLTLILIPLVISQQGNAQSTSASASPTQCGTPPNVAGNSIKYVMYFMSKPQDAVECSMSARGGNVTFAASLTNPGMTCPDMNAWRLYGEAVKQEFWRNWAADQETWPGVNCPNGDPNCQPTSPLPLCAASIKPNSPAAKNCCIPGSKTNPGYDDKTYPFKFCPYFPGDHVANASLKNHHRRGTLPSKAHAPLFSMKPEMLRSLAMDDPGRDIRQSMAEVVFRNEPMFNYIFVNNLYHQEGVIDVYNRNNNNISNSQTRTSGAPYHVQNGKTAISEIDLPVASIMIKSNWIDREVAAKMGLKDDPNNPYIKMNINPVIDNNGTISQTREHWLVSFHVSSKDTPQWAWATFEHVNNPGRCDYTGCNDSYGYTSADTVAAGQARNYTTPLLKCDDLPIAGYIFDTGKSYPGGAITSGLDKFFDGMGIGTRDNKTLNPTPADKAWRSYRLKGTQVNFTDSMGRPTHLGNSVTEGGFVSSSSCITCHARAGADGGGTLPPVLGVFINEVSEAGYLQSARGTPDPDWYHHSGQPPTLETLQTDFVWGFLAANSLKTPSPNSNAVEVKTPPPTIRQRRQQ